MIATLAAEVLSKKEECYSYLCNELLPKKTPFWGILKLMLSSAEKYHLKLWEMHGYIQNTALVTHSLISFNYLVLIWQWLIWNMSFTHTLFNELPSRCVNTGGTPNNFVVTRTSGITSGKTYFTNSAYSLSTIII